ncbi:cyclin-L1-1 isoform X1 [Solanum pennellii]|uniref:Cyclin-L1-1 isoform X1 n=2 Tax=Solanum pennellii TaxID=28526 RepID=A0ABM1FUQ1_SOLPN|nr:cyclin-L1-1 isoform X1 [Solanum pennellii]XP_015061967.1 cyclin-L1-1 isoform X1 [Solanum pennellii]XP_015061968.1 cyclin-L1-1 isoform X1 [Solanum pennellii]XP_015061969.1 cyclin-L1-1 isoform X1 [Solanum pennellii]
MIYTAIDTFYLAEEQLVESPSRKDGIDDVTETALRIYGCDLVQECGILLRLPQAVMATGQVLFHRFYCKKSFARFNVKRVAASCVWLASKLEESPRKARQVLVVFHRMECRRENLPIEHLDTSSKKYVDLKADLIRTERHLLKEMGFICHVEHPHKFISNYLATLETPAELRQEAWNLANDSLRTTLCVRFKSEVVACGVVYAAARRFQVPLPENPPWWKAFDADKAGIDEVCRVLAHLYSLPKAKYIPVCKEGGSFATSNRSRDSPSLPVSKEGLLDAPPVNEDTEEVAKEADAKAVLDKLKDSKKSDDDSKNMPSEGESKEEPGRTDHRIDAGGEKNKDRERDRGRDRERERDKERLKSRERDRGRESDRERERDDFERDREKSKERSHRSRDKVFLLCLTQADLNTAGHSEKPKHQSSRDRDYLSYSSREKDRRRHH